MDLNQHLESSIPAKKVDKNGDSAAKDEISIVEIVRNCRLIVTFPICLHRKCSCQMKFATTADYFYVLMGILGACVTGVGWPCGTIIFGNMVDVFVDFERQHDNATAAGESTAQIEADFMGLNYMYAGLMLAVMVSHAPTHSPPLPSLFHLSLLQAIFIVGNYITIHCFQIFALRQTGAIKKRYFQSILKQEVAWYDRQNSGEFASRISR